MISDITKIEPSIRNKVKDIAIRLMNHENKDSCLGQIHPVNWCWFSYKDLHDGDNDFIIVPSPAFSRFIIFQEYLKVVKSYPEYFGKNDDRLIVKALKAYEKQNLPRDYTDEEFLEYLRGETMAYVFKREEDDLVSDRILRLDLCRRINKDNIFQGGIFHVLKHFTVQGYTTLSSNPKEYTVESWHDIYKHIIINFFLGKTENDCKKNYYTAISNLQDGHTLRGVYYKEEDLPVSFISSMRIDS